MIEQRINQRFNLSCLVTFEKGQGWSRDISATGIYFSTKNILEESEMIELAIHLSRQPDVQCGGKVVRMERRTDDYGVAVQFTDLFVGV